ncbi:hypothetical protein ACQUY5_29685 [Bacillus cereus]|uniref:hypothetical protein n=1 Tax=Bacillus cereus TaxID=1396 RepID=UPI003D16F37C
MKTSKERALEELADRPISQEVLLFIHGIKPALTISTSSFQAQVVAKYYPTITLVGRNRFLSFQNGNDMLAFISDNMVVRYDERSGLTVMDFKDNLKLGVALGFPPKACKYFMENTKLIVQATKQWREENPTVEKVNAIWVRKRSKELGAVEEVMVNYHGISFGTHRETVKEEIKWMKENRPVPKELQTSITVSYKDEAGERVPLILEG